MKRLFLLILALSCIMIHLTSCTSPNIIEVTSKDYPKLTKMSPSEWDEELYFEAPLPEHFTSVLKQLGDM